VDGVFLNCSGVVGMPFAFPLMTTLSVRTVWSRDLRDPVDLYMNTYNKMHDERRYEESAQKEMINFSMSLDFVMEVYNLQCVPSYWCEPEAEKQMPEIIRKAMAIKACDVPKEQCCQVPPSLHCHFSPKPRLF
jgi:hypothetical protein